MNTQMNFNCRLLNTDPAASGYCFTDFQRSSFFFLENFSGTTKEETGGFKNLPLNLYETGRSVFFIDTKITEK